MTHKRLGAVTLAVLASASMAIAGCSDADGSASGGGASNGGGNGGEIDVFLSMASGSPQETAINDIIADFEEQEGATVNLVTATSTFEDDMKVKMASDDVPDVFSTHGWSVLRYAPFLEPLDDQPWVADVKPGLEDIMFDADGHIYALPLEYTTIGFLVNYQVLEDAGVDVETLGTWDGFEGAMAAVKEKGDASPMVVAGKDQGSGNLANFIASGQFTEEENQSFKDGTFDSELWQSEVTDRLENWQKEGYFNPDYSSASIDDVARQLADGTAAFGVEYPSGLTTALEYNPEANLGFIPIPGQENGYLVGGEGTNAYGVSKNSDNKELAIKFVNFMADPANAKPFLESMAADSGLSNVEVDMGNLQPSVDKYVTSGEYPTMPFFDRVYLPSGMWDTIVQSSDGVIAGQMTSADATQQMSDQFTTLFQQAENQ